jgi:sugar phosphate isomerase/epimerase
VVKIAAVSDDLSSDFIDAADLAVQLELDGLSVRNVDRVNIADLELDSVERVGRLAAERGLAISSIASPLGRDLALDSDEGPALALFDRMIRFADALDTTLIRGFALWLPGKEAVSHWADRPWAAELPDQVTERIGDFAAKAERAGITLMIELEGASYVGQVAEAAALFDRVASDSLALCWDVCNGWWSGELPWEEGWPIAAGLPIADVQTKDVRAQPGESRRAGMDQVVLGEGDIPYAQLIAALVDEGYDGWFTAERVYHPRRPELEPRLRADMVADVAELRRLVESTRRSADV